MGLFRTVVGDSVDLGHACGSIGRDTVGHANDRARIHPSTQLGEHGMVGRDSSFHSLGKKLPKMLFVLSIPAVANSLFWWEFPKLVDTDVLPLDLHVAGRRNGRDSNVRC